MKQILKEILFWKNLAHQKLDLALGLLDEDVNLDPKTRFRVHLHWDEEKEWILGFWGPESQSACHSHGPSNCVFVSMSGEFQETQWLSHSDQKNKGQLIGSHVLTPTSMPRQMYGYNVLSEEEYFDTHQLQPKKLSNSKDWTASLHCYSHPLTETDVFDETKDLWIKKTAEPPLESMKKNPSYLNNLWTNFGEMSPTGLES